ncbi:hypothetical protein ACLBWP_13800 [Microbacterium sp. M1A1_1b]
MSGGLPVPTWSWRASIRLELRALGWMLGATLPVVTVIGVVIVMSVPAIDPGWVSDGWWSTVLGAVGWAVYITVFAAIPTVVGAVVALPFTMLLGLLMRPVHRTGLHVLATSLLAGVLAAAPLAIIPDGWTLFVPVSLAAGAAGALARHGTFRRAARTRERSADQAPLERAA